MPEPADPADRKPKTQTQTREPAQAILNKFLQEQGILIGTEKPEVEFTNSGAMVVYAPKIIVIYQDQAVRKVGKES